MSQTCPTWTTVLKLRRQPSSENLLLPTLLKTPSSPASHRRQLAAQKSIVPAQPLVASLFCSPFLQQQSAMDTRLRALVVVAIAAATLELAMAVDHDVGGPAGSWDLSTNHKQWASGKKFIAGDTLTFNYASGQHNVLEVSKAAYSSCSTTNPISTGTGGNTVISLKTAGKRYFICGIPGHCAGGMKLEINVAPAAKSSPAPRSPAGAPSPSTSSPAPLSPAASPSTSLSSPVAAPLPESSSSGSSDSPPVPSSSPRTIAKAALGIGAGTMLFFVL